jgi:hypothetical protein
MGARAEDGARVIPAKGGSCRPGRPRAVGGSGSCGPVAAAVGRVSLLLRAAAGGSASSSERRWAGWPPPPSGGGGWRRWVGGPPSGGGGRRVGLLLRAAAAGDGGWAAAAATTRGEVSGCVEMARATRDAGGWAQKGLSKPTRAAAALVD